MFLFCHLKVIVAKLNLNALLITWLLINLDIRGYKVELLALNALAKIRHSNCSWRIDP